MTEEELIEQFEKATLAEEEFRHAEHVRVAHYYLLHYPLLEAIDRFSRHLKRLAQCYGKADRYHETITGAFLFLIHERLMRSAGPQDWENFEACNQDLIVDGKSAILIYYRAETLASDLARKTFILPDRAKE